MPHRNDDITAIQELMAYVLPERHACFAAQLARSMLGSGLDIAELAEVCETDIDAISAEQERGLRYYAAVEQKIGRVAGDESTRELLLENWRRHRDCSPPLRQAYHNYDELLLSLSGRSFEVAVPSCLDSYLILYEVIVDECYRMPSRVARFYDLGAHVGLATIYAHSRMPNARLVCVEPALENFYLLEENLRRNGISAELRRCAVGSGHGHAKLYINPEASGTNSLFPYNQVPNVASHTQFTQQYEVEIMPLCELIRERDCGIKLDIEGAEHDLCNFSRTWQSAHWITGELHMGPAIVHREHAWKLYANLQKEFALELYGPGVYGMSITYTFSGQRNFGF